MPHLDPAVGTRRDVDVEAAGGVLAAAVVLMPAGEQLRVIAAQRLQTQRIARARAFTRAPESTPLLGIDARTRRADRNGAAIWRAEGARGYGGLQALGRTRGCVDLSPSPGAWQQRGESFGFQEPALRGRLSLYLQLCGSVEERLLLVPPGHGTTIAIQVEVEQHVLQNLRHGLACGVRRTIQPRLRLRGDATKHRGIVGRCSAITTPTLRVGQRTSAIAHVPGR